MQLKSSIKILCVFAAFLVISCNKKETQNINNNPVPSIPVNLTIYPNDPLYFKIQSVGGWMYVNGGINGIVLYRKTEEEFVAIERTSSYSPNNPNAVAKVQSDNFTLRDTISDSRWRILDAVVTKGPAEWPLRLYSTVYNGNTLLIRN